MASNTPAALPPRGFRSIPHTPNVHASIPHAQGGGGGNPLRSGMADDSGQGDYIAPPIHVGGLIGLGLDPQRDKEYENRVNARDTARMQKVQAGIDAYGQALAQTGDPRSALQQVFHPDNEGHVHFSDPQTFQAIMQMHGAMAQGGGQQAPGQFQSVDLGHGLVGVADPGGKYSVHTAHEARQAAPDKGFNLAPGHTHYDSEGNPVATAPGADKPQRELATSKAQMDQLGDIQTVLDNVQKMRNAVGSSGSFGYGSVTRAIAEHTGFGGKQAEAYNAAYNDMAPALTRLARVPGQSKLVAELALNRLPKPGQAEAFNVDQALPNIEYGMRSQLANLYQTYKAENRVGGRDVARQLAQTYDAHPQQILELEQAKQALRTAPGQMTSDQVAALGREMQAGRLPYDDWVRTTRQMMQRGMIDPQQFDKLAAAAPDLAQISPEEHVAPQFARQWTPPQAAPAQIPTGGQPGAQNVPAAPQQAVQQAAQQFAPPTARPAIAPQQAPNVPAAGQLPQQQPQTTGQPPANAQQQANLPQQLQQTEGDMAPPQEAGQGGGLVDMFKNTMSSIHDRLSGIESALGIGGTDEDTVPAEAGSQ